MTGQDGRVLADQVLVDVEGPVGSFLKAACVRASTWEAVRRKPPCRVMTSISESKIWATAKTCFSPMQSRLLSNAPPATIERAAFSRQAGGVDDDRRIARPGDDRPLLARQGGPGDGRPARDDQEPHGLVIEQGAPPTRAWAGR